MRMNKLQLLGFVWAFFCAVVLHGQGFQRLYDLNGAAVPGNRIIAVAPTADGGYVFYGQIDQAGTVLGKTDPDGELVWQKPCTVSYSDDPVADLFVLPNGHCALGVYIENAQLMSTVLHFDEAGNVLDQRSFPGFTRMSPTDNGYFVVTRQDDTTMQLYRLNPAFATVWEKPLHTSRMLFMPDMITTNDGGVCILASYDSLPGFLNSPKLIKAGADGNKQWEREFISTAAFAYFGALNQTTSGDYIFNVTDGVATTVIRTDPGGQLLWSKSLGNSSAFFNCPTPDGGIAMAGSSFPFNNVHITKLNASGATVFSRDYSPNGYRGESFHIRPTLDNGLIICGQFTSPAGGYDLAFLIKTGENGNVFSNSIQGYATFDQNHNCTADPGEPPLSDWIVTATTNGYPLSTRTLADGFYSFDVFGGDYTVKIHPPGSIWEPCDGGQYNVTVANSADTVVQNFSVKDSALCSLLDVSISTPILRRCFHSGYVVSWCNRGTATANDAVVQIALPPQLDFVSATIPYSSQSGDTLWFEVGDVEFGECGEFQLTVNVDCDSTLLGQTLCTAARIFPDTLCSEPPGWSGARIVAGASCVGDTIVDFTLKNTGTAPSNTLGYIITEDYVVLHSGNFSLAPNETMHIARPANGSTQRIEAGQAANYPFPSMPSAAVEGCGGWNSFGLINQFTLDDADPYTDIDCQIVRGSYDPNDKQGFPTGYGSEHLIEPGTELTYLIRFQNTGTDTAFYVEVRDTLSPWLNPASLRVGTASHPFDWTMRGPGALSFRFDNIMLPDSNVNEAASHGFIQFSVRPNANAPLGTLIENDASIYFDFNKPVLTNTTKHRLAVDFYLISPAEEPGVDGVQVNVQPNPFRDRTRLSLPEDATGEYRFHLYDATGRAVRKVWFAGPALEFSTADLTGGEYWFCLQNARGQVVARGKMVKL